jgi:hypothetical protein
MALSTALTNARSIKDTVLKLSFPNSRPRENPIELEPEQRPQHLSRYSQHDLAYRNREHKEHCATRCAHRLVQDGAPCVTQPKHELTYLTASSSSPGYNANRYNTGQKNHGDLRAAHRLRERTMRWLVSSPFHNKALVVLGQTAARYTPSYSFLRHSAGMRRRRI